jgi:hypothetical protein
MNVWLQKHECNRLLWARTGEVGDVTGCLDFPSTVKAFGQHCSSPDGSPTCTYPHCGRDRALGVLGTSLAAKWRQHFPVYARQQRDLEQTKREKERDAEKAEQQNRDTRAAALQAKAQEEEKKAAEETRAARAAQQAAALAEEKAKQDALAAKETVRKAEEEAARLTLLAADNQATTEAAANAAKAAATAVQKEKDAEEAQKNAEVAAKAKGEELVAKALAHAQAERARRQATKTCKARVKEATRCYKAKSKELKASHRPKKIQGMVATELASKMGMAGYHLHEDDDPYTYRGAEVESGAGRRNREDEMILQIPMLRGMLKVLVKMGVMKNKIGTCACARV